MSKRITDEELQKIRERVEKASAKPWAVVTDELGGQAKAVIDGDSWDVIRRPYVGKDNATFIAHAREDIPKLLAEIERLKSVIIEVITDNIYHETDEEFDEIYRRYLYGGDSE